MGTDGEEEHVLQPAIGSAIGKSMSRSGDFNLDSIRRTCFTIKRIEFQG